MTTSITARSGRLADRLLEHLSHCPDCKKSSHCPIGKTLIRKTLKERHG